MEQKCRSKDTNAESTPEEQAISQSTTASSHLHHKHGGEDYKLTGHIPQLPVAIYSDIMKFLTLKEIICQLMVLNSEVRSEVIGQNYQLFKQFIKAYSLNKRMEKSDMIVRHEVLGLIKTNL
jgi:hypothetical protein